jgi:hypothetical protein
MTLMWVLRRLCLIQRQIITKNIDFTSFVFMVFLCLWKHCEIMLLHVYWRISRLRYCITKHGYKNWFFNRACKKHIDKGQKFHGKCTNPHHITKYVWKTKTNAKKNHSFNSKTIIKTMSLVVSLNNLQSPYCMMMHIYLVVFYGNTDYVCHIQSFVVPNILNHN